MADYQYLSDVDKAELLAQFQASHVAPHLVIKEQERAHFLATLEYELAGGDQQEQKEDDSFPPAPPILTVAVTDREEEIHAVIDAEIVKLPENIREDVGLKTSDVLAAEAAALVAEVRL